MPETVRHTWGEPDPVARALTLDRTLKQCRTCGLLRTYSAGTSRFYILQRKTLRRLWKYGDPMKLSGQLQLTPACAPARKVMRGGWGPNDLMEWPPDPPTR